MDDRDEFSTESVGISAEKRGKGLMEKGGSWNAPEMGSYSHS